MKNLQISFLLMLSLVALTITSCVKEDFDVPEIPDEEVPDIETNANLADIVDLWQEGSFVTVEEDWVVSAVVIADDFSGNYFRSIVIQDDEGTGLTLLLNARDLHNDYPIGRRIYIEAKDLVVGDFNGLIQLGGSTFINDSGFEQMGGIEESLLEKYITKGLRDQDVAPQVKEINSLGFDDLSTLVRIENIQVAASDLGATYADAENLRSENRTLEDCDGNIITLRSSGFADFADETLPSGRGTIVGVYSVFGTTKQLFIRDLEDVDMDGERCDGTGGGDCDFDGSPEPIEAIRSRFTGSASNLPADLYIEGTVISDANSGNINDQNIIVQDDNGFGIAVRFTASHSFALNDRVKIDVSGQELSEFRGLMQVNNVPLSRACKDGTNTVTPQVLTLEEILADFENLESTLVQVDNVLISKSGDDDWVFSVQLDDGTAQMDMFTSPGADWANDNFPTDTLRITAYVSQGGNEEAQQLSLRNLNDVVVIGTGGGGGNTEPIPFETDFSNGIPDDWTVVNTAGSRVWEGRDFDGVFYAQMSAFNNNEVLDVETWMITPPFDFDGQSGEIMELEIADAFQNGNPLKVMYSTDYSGSGDPSEASWTEIASDKIDPLINNPDSYDNVYESTGAIDLSGISGEAYIAFLYDSDGTISTTIQLSKVDIK